jgi:uncharacterized damage-inducible protein DinB
MIHMFRYNWAVRSELFEVMSQMPAEELLKERHTGQGSIMKTVYHIIDVEYSWMMALEGSREIATTYEEYCTVDRLRALSDRFRQDVERCLNQWTPERETAWLPTPWSKETFRQGEVLRHVIAHEIHHMGQISSWVRASGYTPANADFIRRGLVQ